MRSAAIPARPAILLTAVLAAACGGPGTPEEASVPDHRLGLSPVSVFDTPSPDPVPENQSEPGEASPQPRPHPEAPPVVPHRIDWFLPITLEENLCLDCHQVEEKVEGGPTPIPRSHYVDLRNAPGTRQDGPVGARRPCTSCHVPRTGAPPLVENRFEN